MTATLHVLGDFFSKLVFSRAVQTADLLSSAYHHITYFHEKNISVLLFILFQKQFRLKRTEIKF